MNQDLSTNETLPTNETPAVSETGATPEDSDRHPTAEAWIAYYQGSLPETEQIRMHAHLAHCRSCVDLVLDLDTFAEPGSADADGTLDFEKAAVWRTLKPAMAAPRWPAMAAMAASLIVATLGFSSWTQQRQSIHGLETRVAELSQPWGNIVNKDLSPRSRQRSAGGADATTELVATDTVIALILNLEEPAEYPGYEARILDMEGTTVRTIPGLEPSEFENFFLALPPSSLEAGNYELRLYGLSGSQEDLLEIYPIALR